MKRVSFNVAKAIKEAGYPQGTENTAWYNEDGILVKPNVFNGGKEIADAPFVMEVWRWLWRTKDIPIQFGKDNQGFITMNVDYGRYIENHLYDDPEEAVIIAIDYLVENNLIK